MLTDYYVPLINRPTRVTDSTATLIDNIFTNWHDEPKCLSGTLPTAISHYFSIFHIIYGDIELRNNTIAPKE
jgi:hypothetical protein